RGPSRPGAADDLHGRETLAGTPGYGGAGRRAAPAEEPDTEFERTLADMLRRTGDGFRPDTPKLMEGGLRRGRARVWRRRAAVMTGAASLAAVTVAAISLPGADGPGPAADVPRTAEDMVETLVAMLPEGVGVEGSEGYGPDTDPEPAALLDLEDGPGLLQVTLSLGRTPEGMEGDTPLGCAEWEGPEWEGEKVECEERRFADGSVLSVTSRETVVPSVDVPGGEGFATRTLEALLQGPGGPDGEGPGSRRLLFSLTKDVEEPEELEGYAFPVNRDTMEEIVLAPVWQEVLDGVDVRYGPPVEEDEGDEGEWEPPSAEKAAEVRDHLAGLLPDGVGMTEHPGEPMFLPGVLLDDGQGAVRADIDFGPEGFLAGGADPAIGLDDPVSDCVEEPRRDGLRVAVCEYTDPGAEAETLRWAHALHPDGFRVEFTVINASDHGTEPIRESGPLSAEDLVRVASDPGWREVMGADG
ncbi:hypothetical protein, partial [Streptomyces alkaliphilus]|uniref:hypothetical protein n=1 Tax=Streptomyces alkaliphilus TaxID=1472722 RepID=UPI0015F87C85